MIATLTMRRAIVIHLNDACGKPRIPTMLGFSAHKDLHTVAHGQTGIVISNEQVNPWLRPLTKFPRRGNGRGRVPM